MHLTYPQDEVSVFLRRQFEQEYDMLTAYQQLLLIEDVLDICRYENLELGTAVRTLASRLHPAKLESYARTLEAGQARKIREITEETAEVFERFAKDTFPEYFE